MKKWMWISVPAVAIGLGILFLGGSAFAQTNGNSTTPSVNWTAMYDYCRNLISGNGTAGLPDFDDMPCGAFADNTSIDANNVGVPGAYGAYGPGGMMGGNFGGHGMMGW
jgi:hypothetical protein